MYFFLLQEQIQWYKEDNPVEAMIVVIGIGTLILIGLLVSLINKKRRPSVKKQRPATPPNFSIFTIHRIKKTYGLEREQTKLLESVLRSNSVSDPEKVLANPVLVDRYFKRTYKTIEENSISEEDAQLRYEKLFTLRNDIDSAPGAANETTVRLLANTPAILAAEKENYPTKIIVNKGQQVITELPRNSLGSPVRLTRGTPITLSFFIKSSQGFAVNGHVMGIADTGNGSGLLITHNGKLKALTKRKFRRRQTFIRCEFFLVYLDETGKGRKKKSRLVVNNKRFSGTLLDISIGGCSIKTSIPVQAGSRMKIGIDYADNYKISTLGQVLRANRSGSLGNILHIKFLKVPRRAYNSISAIVYGYDD